MCTADFDKNNQIVHGCFLFVSTIYVKVYKVRYMFIGGSVCNRNGTDLIWVCLCVFSKALEHINAVV